MNIGLWQGLGGRVRCFCAAAGSSGSDSKEWVLVPLKLFFLAGGLKRSFTTALGHGLLSKELGN